jgi:hypothetical protein
MIELATTSSTTPAAAHPVMVREYPSEFGCRDAGQARRMNTGASAINSQNPKP